MQSLIKGRGGRVDNPKNMVDFDPVITKKRMSWWNKNTTRTHSAFSQRYSDRTTGGTS